MKIASVYTGKFIHAHTDMCTLADKNTMWENITIIFLLHTCHIVLFIYAYANFRNKKVVSDFLMY